MLSSAYPAPQGIETVLDLSESLPKVKADPTQLDIVFGNLIRNACDAMPDGGTLTVKASGAGPWIQVKFMDTGVGIAPAHLAKITEPLFSTKRGEWDSAWQLRVQF